MDRTDLGILVLQGGSSPSDIVRTVESLAECATALDVQVLAASAADADDVRRSLRPTGALVRSAHSGRGGIVTALRQAATPFVGIVLAGDVVDTVSLNRRVEALHSQPELVIAVCGYSEGDTSTGAATTTAGHVGRAVDGREFAYRALVGGGLELPRTRHDLVSSQGHWG